MSTTAVSPETASEALAALRWKRPLVHCLTNDVVANVTANALLAAGASPVMAHAPEEAAVIAARAGALLVNIGTLTRDRVEVMVAAAEAARAAGAPWVFDPVGVGASPFRQEAAARILAIGPTLVKGNAAEIVTLATGRPAGRGVDSEEGESRAVQDAAVALARRLRCAVAATGRVDLVTDGVGVLQVHNGHALMGRITGSGCAAGALCAAVLGAGAPALAGAASALAYFGLAGERAAAGEPGPGMFQARLLDELAAVTPEDLAAGARITA
ncbi:hydroxyethylthiazole kinase [Alsobacter soli]|uniref:hydroxyethylthiazole kinase n=1 Tax=Alsobacter soli TaxID=2109933 RepID=UPI001FE0D5E0|nr:hydroxyethylthiazole kinase [Alsobacter soli]